jgi:Radical SAM superfamily
VVNSPLATRHSLPRVEIQPANHCTLRCDGCQHGSPQRPRRQYDAGEFLPLLNRLATFCSWESLIIGGGEPFLHRDLCGFLRAVRLGRPVHLLTNGYWLLRPDWLERGLPVFAICAAAVVSRYPVYVDQIGVNEWDRRLEQLHQRTGCKLVTFHPYDPSTLLFDHHAHHDEPRPIARACTMRTCLQLLPDGRLTRCPLGRWYGSIDQGTAAFRAAYERSGFYDLNRGGEGFAEWAGLSTRHSPLATRHSFEACHFCGLATGDIVLRPWAQK